MIRVVCDVHISLSCAVYDNCSISVFETSLESYLNLYNLGNNYDAIFGIYNRKDT